MNQTTACAARQARRSWAAYASNVTHYKRWMPHIHWDRIDCSGMIFIAVCAALTLLLQVMFWWGKS